MKFTSGKNMILNRKICSTPYRKNCFFTIIGSCTIALVAFFTLSSVDLRAQKVSDISPEEFSTLVTTISEYGGYFPSDNWVSNEITYLNVLESLEEYEIEGGVYIGVSADQNFTYIAAVKPELAFIVDIRNQNRMQHLLYKSLFEFAETRVEFFSLLISKPVNPDIKLDEDGNIGEIINYFYKARSDPEKLKNTKNRVLELLTSKYMFKVTGRDTADLMYVMDSFYYYHMGITYNGPQRSWYPTLAQLLQMKSDDGTRQSIFNSKEGYNYLRDMHLKNRIIPVTGDFGGSGALARISEYLRSNHLTVTAYYTSNVEQYLLRNMTSWSGWTENVKNLPISDRTVFIRWTHDGRGYNQKTRLQWMKTFIENNDADRYYSYFDLTRLDYIKDN